MIPSLNQKTTMIIQPQIIADNAEWVGSKGSTPVTIDTKGYKYLDIYFAVGAIDADMVELEIWDCATSNGTFAKVDAGEYGATGLTALPTAATGDNDLYVWHIDPMNVKRYIQVLAKAGNGDAGTYACCWAVQSRPEISPNSATERGFVGEMFI